MEKEKVVLLMRNIKPGVLAKTVGLFQFQMDLQKMPHLHIFKRTSLPGGQLGLKGDGTGMKHAHGNRTNAGFRSDGFGVGVNDRVVLA